MHHAELTLISAVLRTGSLDGTEGLRADHFHSYRNEWDWILANVARYNCVPSRPRFRKAFPDFTLLVCDDVKACADDVLEAHFKVELTKVLTEATKLIKQGDAREAHRVLYPVLTRLENDYDVGGVLQVTQDWEGLYADIEARQERASSHGMPGITTGFPTLDLATGGVQTGHYWIVAGRPKNGKSWWLTKMAVEAALAGSRVLFQTLEMSRNQLALRAHVGFANRLGVPLSLRSLSGGSASDLGPYKRLLQNLKDSIAGEITFTDRARGKVSPFTLRTHIERHEPDLVLVDYLTLLEPSQRSGDRDWRTIATISGEIQALAKETDVPIVCAAQINRSGQQGASPPSIDKLAQADAIGQDADAVVTLRKWSKRTIQARLAAFRHAQDGQTWWNRFQPDIGVFDEVSLEDAMELRSLDDDDDD